MESNIDPSITEQELFHVPNSPDQPDKHTNIVSQDREELPNVFRLNEYVSEHSNTNQSQHVPGEENSTAAAALNMIHYGFDNEISTESDHHHEVHSHRDNHSNYGGMSMAPPASDVYEIPSNVTHSHSVSNDTHQLAPEQEFVTMVPYNPMEKPKRLGRPRKHFAANLPNASENNSVQNVNEAMVSKFRLDYLPIEGPGSRGGRKGARSSPRGRIVMKNGIIPDNLGPIYTEEDLQRDMASNLPKVRRSRRSAMNNSHSASTDEIPINSITTKLGEIDPQQESPDLNGTLKSEEEVQRDLQNVVEAIPPQKSIQATILQTRALNSKLRSRENESKEEKKSVVGSKTWSIKPSRTTVRVTRTKNLRVLPGPLLSLTYNAYDGNMMKDDQASKEKLALGFPVKTAPYAEDIMILISYLNRYKEVIFGKDIYYIGPKDFEIGLSLPQYISKENSNEFVNYRDVPESEDSYDSNFVSPLMVYLFCKLLGLVLNKKKDISQVSQKGAIGELKSSASSLGFPKEWKDSSHVNTQGIISGEDVAEDYVDTPVDPKNPEVLDSQNYIYNTSVVTYNPFKDPEFEKYGLRGLLPVDRLIMLRTLAQWSLITSESLKAYINENSNYQDIGGDRSTYYAPRSMLKGFKNAEDALKEAEIKINKKINNASKRVQTPTEGSSTPPASTSQDPELAKYVDPTSDPLEHPLRWRVDEMFIGDGGFHIGRFYLSRMAEGNGGGLSSLKKMKASFTNFRELKDIPSSFKLYVEDIHQVLSNEFETFGVEFNEDGEEVHPDKDENGDNNNNEEIYDEEECHWYEVASNVEEIKNFITFLADRIQSLPSSIHRQMQTMHNYLVELEPLLAAQESAEVINKTDRSSRKRHIDYSDVSNAHKSRRYDEEDSQDEYFDEKDDEIIDENDEDYSE
ncbi:hypothetical protein CAAN3_05S07140 [[Candida] anglica]